MTTIISDICCSQVGIGEHRTTFNIHQDRLIRISFIDRNGPIPSLAEKQARQTPEQNTTPSDSADVKREQTVGVESATERLPNTTFSVANAPDYVIEDREHEPQAFKVLVQWLYNERPTHIQYKQEKKVLLRAYRLAIRYNAYELQNLIIERFREFHQDFAVEFEDLIWLAHREKMNTPFIQYFLEQTAFEIATNGFESFINKNDMFERTFASNTLPMIQFDVLRRVARHAEVAANMLKDPAKGYGQWLVEENGPNAGRARVDAVDLTNDGFGTALGARGGRKRPRIG